MKKPVPCSHWSAASLRWALGLLLILPVFLTSCTQALNELEQPQNRYKEINISLPDEINSIFAFQNVNDERLQLLGGNFSATMLSLWELAPDNSWEMIMDFHEQLPESKGMMVATAAIDKRGKLLCAFFDPNGAGDQFSFYLVSPEEATKYRELNVALPTSQSSQGSDSFLMTGLGITPLVDEYFLIQVGLDDLFVLDTNLETVEPVSIHERSGKVQHLLSIINTNDGLLALAVMTSNGSEGIALASFDLETKSFIALDNKISGAINPLFEGAGFSHFGVSPSMDYRLDQNDGFTLCLDSGIYEYSKDGLSKLVDADATILSDPMKFVSGCVFDNAGDFILACHNNNNPDAPFSLYKYERTTDNTQKEKVLRVYALEDSTEVRQAVSLFREENQDIEVSLEIGLSDIGLNANDAIKLLNTEILAGAGPDIIMLDNMRIQSFSDQQVLLDITDIYAEAVTSNEYYEEILGSFVTGDSCWALPMRYTFPVLLGNEEAVNQISDLSSLVAQAKVLGRKSSSTSSIFCDQNIIESLFVAYYPELIKNGQLDEKALTDFFTNIKSLQATIKTNGTKDRVIPFSDSNPAQGNDNDPNFQSTLSMSSYIENPDQLLICQFLCEPTLGILETVRVEISPDARISVLSFNQAKCFVPKVILSINSNSTEIELAKLFINTMLGEDFQNSAPIAEGLSIYKSAFRESVSEYGMPLLLYDSGTVFDSGPFDEERYARFESLLASLDMPVNVDATLQTIVFEQLTRYLNEEASIKDAVSAACKKANLYLAE
ncbi:MAG: hypothetical protein FWD27_07270 [Coriobacteriia bacterium]|nr:hypothetical protein [Coriobacteriia bacterium]